MFPENSLCKRAERASDILNYRWRAHGDRIYPMILRRGFLTLHQSSAHRFLHERGDPCLFGGSQLLQREGGRPHGAFVKVRHVVEANVAYLALNFCALWKKQTTLPSLAYAGIPYQVFGKRSGALALTIACSRSAMLRSGSGISAIFASKSLSPSSLSLPARASAFISLARSFIAAFSSSVHTSFFGTS